MFPLDIANEDTQDAVDTLGPELSKTKTQQYGLARKLLHVIVVIALLAAGGFELSAVFAPAPEKHNSQPDGGPPADQNITAPPTPANSFMTWRTATLLIPWSDASSSIEATLELPATWSVQRHDPSTEYPGLHATILDEASLPAASLYFGPSPDPDSCPLQPPPTVTLQRINITTGAELLDPQLASAFSYGLTTGPESRGTFGLVPQTTDKNPRRPPTGNPRTPALILRFGDVTGLASPNADRPAPRSSYARTFTSPDDAALYANSPELRTLKRLITSLKISFPQDRTQLWRISEHRHPVG